MRIIKLGLISAVLLFLLVTAMSLLLPSTINISKAIDIDAPGDSIYKNINDMSRWKNWFANYDSTQIAISKNPTGKGASLTMNRTTVIITESNKSKISTEWHSGSNTLDGEFNIIRQKNSTVVTVQWHFIQHVKWYPWEKFASIASNKVMTPLMEESLDNLKKLVEK